MSQVFGRGESRPWATKWPVSSLGAFLLAVVAGIGIFTYRNVEKWTPLQQWYWTEYLTTKSFPKARGDYQLLAKVDAHGKQLMAVDADVVPGPMQGWPPFPFALTAKARQAGAVALKVDTVHYGSAQMHQMLSEWIYEGQSPDDLIRPAWFGALGIFVLGLVLAIPRDRARVRMLEHGRRLKGPQMVTVKEFNQWSGRVAHFSGEYTLSREPLAAKMKGVPHFSWFSRSAQQTDVIPVFRTSPSMISDEGKGKGYVEEQAHRGADDRGAETTGGGAQGGGCGAGSRGVEAHDLRLEGEVRRDGCERGAGSEAVAG